MLMLLLDLRVVVAVLVDVVVVLVDVAVVMTYADGNWCQSKRIASGMIFQQD